MEVESMQIYLNSKNANKYYNNKTSNCDFYMNTIEIPNQYHIHLSVVNACIPYSFYNIDETNNRLNYQMSSFQDFVNLTSKTLYIEPGNYNINNLLTYLQTKLASDFTITYDPIKNKLTFDAGAKYFIFLSSSSCFELLGFKNQGYDLYTVGHTLASDSVVNLQSKHCIYVASNFLSNSLLTSNSKNHTLLCSIPINSAQNSMIYFSNTASNKVNIFNNIFNMINIKLVDQDNNLINLNDCHWSMTLQLDVVKFIDDN